MINSQNKQIILALTLSLMASVGAGNVLAQEKPRSLVPSFVEEQTEKAGAAERVPQAPVAPISDEKELFKAPEQNTSSTLQVQTLGALHPASIDVSQDSENKKLGANIWQGLSGQLVLALLEKIEAPVRSPALTNLYQRLLFNGSSIPDASVVGDQILKLRLKKLIDLGYFEAAGRYFARLPANVFDDDIRALKAQLMLLDGREEAACTDQIIGAAQGVTGFWAKFDVFCRIVKQEFNKAELGAALLEESGEKDPLFFSLVAASIGSQIDLSTYSQSSEPIHYALLKRLDAVFPPQLVASAVPSVKAALSTQLARVKEGAINLLLNEVQYGRPVNFTDILSIAQQPMQVISTASEKAQEGAAETPLKAPYAASLKSISENPLPEERAKGLMSLWTSAQDAGDLFAVAHLSLPILQDLPAGPYGQDFNRMILKILLVNDRVDLSRQWERTARRAAIQGTADERVAARKDITRLDTLILLAGVDGIARWNTASFNNWLQQMATDPDVALKGAFLLTMMEVFGYTVSDADWDRLITLEQTHRQAQSNHSFENTLVTAATSRQKGKTVALSLLSMGSGDVSAVSLTTLRAVTSALMAVGLEDDARKIALEAAILLDL